MAEKRRCPTCHMPRKNLDTKERIARLAQAALSKQSKTPRSRTKGTKEEREF